MNNTSLKVQIDCLERLKTYIASTLPSNLEAVQSATTSKLHLLLTQGLPTETEERIRTEYIANVYRRTTDLLGEMRRYNYPFLDDIQQDLINASKRK